MIHEALYRLGRYKIIEYGSTLLSWETHIPVAEQRTGKCFVHGDVLIIGRRYRDESGYLADMFFERLEKLPPWTKTRYYCFARELTDTATLQAMTDDLLEERLVAAKARPAGHAGPDAYRLGRYRITVENNGAIAWKTYGPLDTLVSGPCSMESDLLFLGPQEREEHEESKQAFLDALELLPKWDRTLAWSRGMILRPCAERAPSRRAAAPIQRREVHGAPRGVKAPRPSWSRHGETIRQLVRSSGERLRENWSGISTWRIWRAGLLILAAAGILAGTAAVFHEALEHAPCSPWFEPPHEEHDRHHEHHEHHD